MKDSEKPDLSSQSNPEEKKESVSKNDLKGVVKNNQRTGILIGLGFVVWALLPYFVHDFIVQIYKFSFLALLIYMVAQASKKR